MLASRWHVQTTDGLEGRQGPLLLTPSFLVTFHDTTITLIMTKNVLPGEGTQRIGVGGGKQVMLAQAGIKLSRV